MVNHPLEHHLHMSSHSSYMVLQTHTFNHKIISTGIIFIDGLRKIGNMSRMFY